MGIIKKLFNYSEKEVKRVMPLVEKINGLESSMKELTDAELQNKTTEFKERLSNGETLDDLLPEAFAVVREAADADIVIKAAAVADYKPKHAAEHKMKKKDADLSIEMERTKDILAALGSSKRPGQFLCGFSMETENLIENSVKKLEKKNLDMIAANSLNTAGAGFQGDTNVVTLITKDSQIQLPLLSKEETAARIIDSIMECIEKRRGELK